MAAAAAGFLVMSVLFDMMSFPQTPYILVAMAGLLAVLVKRPEPVPIPKRLRATPRPVDERPVTPAPPVPIG